MSDARWQRIEEVFHRAADLEPAQRAEFLSTACTGDDDLRREVESLLANDDSHDNLVEAAVSKAVDTLPDEEAAARDDLVGKHIGPYLVAELIGKGGMGLVFKARDTQLNRSVAIKALPTDRLTDPDRKRRFLQEAKATSALNHPNIVTVHGITQDHGTDFIVMEYVSGKTLDQLIPNKGLPLKQAVKYALAIADAVAAAHTAGIVHRDIKPSNIMITEQGRVKVLDFGLAKLAEPNQPAEKKINRTAHHQGRHGVRNSRLHVSRTSRRQACGCPLGYFFLRRAALSDGHRTASVSRRQRDHPPGRRHQSGAGSAFDPHPQGPARARMGDHALLEKGRRPSHPAHGGCEDRPRGSCGANRVPSGPLPVTRPRRRWLAPALIAVLLGLAAGAWLSLRIFHTEPITFQRITFRHGDVLTAKFAPNGTIVYAAEWEGSQPTLFSAQPGAREGRELQLPSGNIQSVSSSGELAILIGAGDTGTSGTLARVPLAGGTPRAILENVWSADWGPGTNSLAVVRTLDGYHRVEYPVGSVLYQTQALRAPLTVRVAPKGDLVAFFDFTTNGDYSLNVVDANRNQRVVSRGWRAVGGSNWSPDGKEIWFGGTRSGTDEALWAVDLSGRERLLTQIAGDGVLHDVSRDGRLLLASVDSRIGIRCLAPGATEERDLAWLDASSVWNISSDGRYVLFVELSSGEGRNPAIYLRRTDGSPAVLLGYGNRPVLSPDGKSVACLRRDRDTSRLVLLPTGAGQEKILTTGSVQTETVEWFPDGKRLLLSGNETNQPPRTYVLDLATQKITAVTPPGMRASAVSPDGGFAAVISEGKLLIHSFVNAHDIAVGAVEPGMSIIRWSGDGRYLFLQRRQADLPNVSLIRLDVHSGHREAWRELKPPDPTSVYFGSARLSADGKSYAFSFQRDLATLYLVKGVK